MKQYLVSVFVILFFIGCQSIYRPAAPEATVFKGKSELHSEFGITGHGFYIKPAYSITNNLSVSSNVSYGPEEKYYEGSIGVFGNLNSNTYSQFLFGVGKGKCNFSDESNGLSMPSYPTLAKGHYDKYYGQLNFVSIRKPQSGMGLCLRFAKMYFTYTEANLPGLIDKELDILFFESFLFLRNKLSNNSSFNVYMGFTFSDVSENQMRISPINFGIGFAFQFTKLDKSEGIPKKKKIQ